MDASVAIAIALNESDLSDPARFLELLATEGAIVPSLWRHEVANGLLTALRAGRVDRAGCLARLGDLEALPIAIDLEAVNMAFTTTFFLAERHMLTVYDAAYLELAIRELVPIATLDNAVIRAARSEMIELIPL